MDSYITLVRRFIEVAEAGTVQHAAAKLNISQPALTQSIKKIEEAFDCQLFERTKRGMVLTAAGEQLYTRSRRIADENRLATLEISDVLQGRSGTLRIAAGTAWGYCFLPPIIRDLQTAYEDLKIELDISITTQALPRLYAGDVDVVLGASAEMPEGDPTFAKADLMSLNFAAACGQASPLKDRRRVSFKDLKKTPIVVYEDDEQLMKRVIGHIEEEIETPLNIAVRTKSLMAAMELVSTGPYLIFLAEPFLQKFPGSGVHVLKVAKPLHTFQTAACFRASLTRTRPFRHFLSAVEALAVSWRNGPQRIASS